MNRAAARGCANILMKSFSWHVPQFTPNLTEQRFLSKHIVSRASNELLSIERSFFIENARKDWIFEIGPKIEVDFPI